jgi:hypothetical protein
MRKALTAGTALLLGALISMPAADLAAQEVAPPAVAATPVVQLIGPLYALGPDTPAPRYDRRAPPAQYGGREPQRPRLRPPTDDRDRYATSRRYERYGERGAPRYAARDRSYAYNRYRRYDDRSRPYSAPYAPYAERNRYAARIITPRWRGQWQDAGPVDLRPIR